MVMATTLFKWPHATGLPINDLPTASICHAEGFFRYPNDCKRFYRCVDYSHDGLDFSIFHFMCPAGTIFDETVQVSHKLPAAAWSHGYMAKGGSK